MVSAVLPPGAEEFIPEASRPKQMIVVYRYSTAYTRKRDFNEAIAQMTPEEMQEMSVREYSPRTGHGDVVTLADAFERQRERNQALVVMGPKGDFGGGRGCWSRRVDPDELFPDYADVPAGPRP